jgi:maleylacetoacetate isomerase
MKLRSFWRSTTSYRVRAALNLKGIPYDIVPVDLVAGEQNAAKYLALNPGAGVPTLELDDGTVLVQSMAILDYVDARWPEPRLIPEDFLERSRVYALAYTVAMDIHPANNMRVIGQLKSHFDASPDQCQDWMIHWMHEGFAAAEALLSDQSDFSFGAAPNIADLCITAQVYNAHRWGVDMAPFPKITRVAQNCLALPEIAAAHPDQQPDAKVDI